MKRLFISIICGVLAVCLTYGLLYLAGYLWGPFYQGEDESTRNFKLALLLFLGMFILGGWLGIRATANSRATEHLRR